MTVVTPKEILTGDRLPLGLPPMVMQIGSCTQVLDSWSWHDGILPTVHSPNHALSPNYVQWKETIYLLVYPEGLIFAVCQLEEALCGFTWRHCMC